jgi:hypothetical protein
VKSQSFYIVWAGLVTALIFDISCSKDYTYCPSCALPGNGNATVTRTIPLTVDQWVDLGTGKFQSDIRSQILRTDSSFTTILQVKFQAGGIRGNLITGKPKPVLGGQLVWTGEVLTFYSGTDQLPFSSLSIEVTVN